MALALSALLFGCFVLDVVAGAWFDMSVLSDVQEMLILACATVAFVTAILKRERDSKKEH
ncbi:hypothetical protein EU803_03160 [Loktanella sp. IMCC34160]|uniref:hypothetical protein n=1 Tax=Loktanella sp. IMCC34160 TaxID=2510646 RepID=UPI00101C5FAE|nr:hypothetical protein [Loktanella sp. IMCC34160]RYG93118.1 hypothetical protein EU803_03160 [Loktanella sp. IMCC34160]